MTELAVKQPAGRGGQQWQRVAARDFSLAEEVLAAAALLMQPDDQTQRQAFDKLMPHLYVLRNKGFSWAQLAKLLGDCGFKLQPSTVRTYFTELLASRMDVCQSRMNEQIAIMAAVRSETAGVNLAAISDRVQAQMQHLKASSQARVDAVIGLPAVAAPAAEAIQPARLVAPTAKREAKAPAPPRAALEQAPADAEVGRGEFGLLGLSAEAERPSQGRAGFFNIDDDGDRPADQPAAAPPARSPSPRKARASAPSPAPAVIDEPPSAPSPPPARPTSTPPASKPRATGRAKKVCKLQPGVPPLKRRDGVPDEVYQPGELEHPAIAGLMLTLEQRLYGAALEYFDADGPDEGEIKTETADEKRFRVVWRHTVPMAQTRTAHSFTKMDTDLFKS